ncbi:hypothetical protein C8J57DRAFT_1522175 [Mycena rebaudengoi]|nr:hypothetical protein C8J57DRAFT_1522175 [Mycena rebaudengoi]
MRLISSIYAYCAVVWAVHAAPLPVPQNTVPSDSVDQKDPIIRTTDVFEPIEVMHKAQIDIEGRESGGSGGYAYCVIA